MKGRAMNRRGFLLAGAAVPLVGIPTGREEVPAKVFGRNPTRVVIDRAAEGKDVTVAYTFGAGTLYVNGERYGTISDVRVSMETPTGRGQMR
jgi:hypothetical protein